MPSDELTSPSRPDAPHLGPTPDQARRQLRHAAAGTLVNDRDRRIHGAATAVFGLLVGGYIALDSAVGDTRRGWVITVGYAVLLVALALWQSQAARTVPRGSKRLGRIGLTGTGLLGIAALAVLNARGHGHPVGPVWLLGAALVVAAPMLAAGHRIFYGRKA